LVADRGQCLADEFFIGERPVDLGGVEERDADVDGGADHVDAVLLVDVETIGVAEAHAAQPERRHLQSTAAEGTGDHVCSLRVV
jgi:hypothetical protein